MQQDSPILVLDQDMDDLELIKAAGKEVGIPNEFIFFQSGEQLSKYLRDIPAPPLLILCDVNLARKSGFEVRKMLMEDLTLRYKSVPFIFWSDLASEKQIQHAYDLPAQGFFFKSPDFQSLCATLKHIVDYWKDSQHPKRL